MLILVVFCAAAVATVGMYLMWRWNERATGGAQLAGDDTTSFSGGTWHAHALAAVTGTEAADGEEGGRAQVRCAGVRYATPAELDAAMVADAAAHDWHKLVWVVTSGRGHWDRWAMVEHGFLSNLFASVPTAALRIVHLHDGATPPPDAAVVEPFCRAGYDVRTLTMSPSDLRSSAWWRDDYGESVVRGLQLFARMQPAAGLMRAADYVSWFLLHRYGGMLLSPDVLWLAPPPSGEFVGEDRTDEEGAPWMLQPEDGVFLSPAAVRLHPLNPLARWVLDHGFEFEVQPATATRAAFNQAAFGAAWHAVAASAEGDEVRGSVQVLGYDTLYPVFAKDAPVLRQPEGLEASDLWVASLRRRSLAISLYTAFEPAPAHVAPGSVVQHLLAPYDLAPTLQADSQCTLLAPPALVVSRASLPFNGPNAILLTECLPLDGRSSYTLEVSAVSGKVYAGDEAGNAHSSLRWEGRLTVADVNRALHSVTYTQSIPEFGGVDTVRVLLWAGKKLVVVRRVPVMVFSRLVTVMTHTAGRVPGIKAMYDSLQRWFPGTRLLASDDSKQPNEQLEEPVGPLQQWLRLPPDTGLAGARNALINAIFTPYVYLMDDDFTVQADSHLDLLLTALATSDFDIASAVIPQGACRMQSSFNHADSPSSVDPPPCCVELLLLPRPSPPPLPPPPPPSTF